MLVITIMRNHHPYSILFMSAGFVLTSLAGCGGSASSSVSRGATVALTATVSLPSGASSSLSVGGLTLKSATTDTPQASLTVEFYDGATDKKLGSGLTKSDGTVTIDASTSDLAAGDHNIFVRVLDKTGKNEMAGDMEKVSLSDTTTTVAAKVDSTADLSYQAWKSACKKQIGTECVPGQNLKDGIKKVVPNCLKDAFKEASTSNTATTADATLVGSGIQALLSAHRENLRQSLAGGGSTAPVDLSCVMGGDASCQQAFKNVAGSTIPALSMKESTTISTDTAEAAAVSMLNTVVKSLCGDPTTYATVSGDKNYQADPGSAFKPFIVLRPDEVMDSSAMKKMITAAASVGTGYKAWGDPNMARATMETYFAKGLSADISDDEMKKRMGVVFGAGAPTNLDNAKKAGRAAFNIYGATNWTSATAADALNRFGPLMGQQTDTFISGGKQAFDNYIDAQGGLAGFEKKWDTFGTGTDAAKAFLVDFKQQDIGGTCKNTFECRPPYSCSTTGKCTFGNVISAITGGPGTLCPNGSGDCASTSGFQCDQFTKVCVYAAGQASGGNFASAGGGFVLPTQGSLGSGCQ